MSGILTLKQDNEDYSLVLLMIDQYGVASVVPPSSIEAKQSVVKKKNTNMGN